jgi:hypothetical protein
MKYKDKELLALEDVVLIAPILKQHNDFQEKKGAGILGIYWIRHGIYGSSCLFLKRTEGDVDISWKKSINPTKKIDDIRECCRRAIEAETKKVRESSDLEKCDVHHTGIQFKKIFEDWMKTQNEEYLYSKIVWGDPEKLMKGLSKGLNHFEDTVILTDWLKFHNDRAKLVAMDRKEHRHLKKGGKL